MFRSLPLCLCSVVVAVACGGSAPPASSPSASSGTAPSGTAPSAAPVETPPAASEAAPDKSHVVNGAVAKQLVADGAVLVDVRSPEEYQEGHIEGAVNIPVSEIRKRMSELPQDKKVVTYCQSGRRAQQAATALRSSGYEVYELGPMKAWDE